MYQAWKKPQNNAMVYAFIISISLAPSKTIAGLMAYLLYCGFHWRRGQCGWRRGQCGCRVYLGMLQ